MDLLQLIYLWSKQPSDIGNCLTRKGFGPKKKFENDKNIKLFYQSNSK